MKTFLVLSLFCLFIHCTPHHVFTERADDCTNQGGKVVKGFRACQSGQPCYEQYMCRVE